jgi:hypothetical protein
LFGLFPARKSKYSPQLPVLQQVPSVTFPQYERPRICETRVQRNIRLHIYIFHSLKILGNRPEEKHSELRGSSHLRNLVRSSFLCECNFDLLVSFPSIWSSSHFRGIYYVFYIMLFSNLLTGHEHIFSSHFNYFYTNLPTSGLKCYVFHFVMYNYIVFFPIN